MQFGVEKKQLVLLSSSSEDVDNAAHAACADQAKLSDVVLLCLCAAVQ